MRFAFSCLFVATGLRSRKSEARYATNFCAGSESSARSFDLNISMSAREPGPGHLAAVERQLGAIDPRFESAGLKQPTKFYLDKARLGFGVAVALCLGCAGGFVIGRHG